jgi:tetratricopeptide (TPR) repeat protein
MNNQVNNFVTLGLTFLSKRDYIDALKYFNAALEIEPSKYEEIWCYKGCALAELNSNDEALNCFNKALQIKPNSIEATYFKDKILKKIYRASQHTGLIIRGD